MIGIPPCNKDYSYIGGEFRTYGLQVASMMEEDPEDRVDPISRVFPRVTKCIFNKFGPSGSVQRRDAMCVLPVNIINEVRCSVRFNQILFFFYHF